MSRLVNFLKPFFLVLLLSILPALADAGHQVELLNKAEQQQVIYLDGLELNFILDQPIANYSLQAIRNNQLEPIPFQVDEYDEHGLVYFPESGNKLDGNPNVFDKNDKMLFMLRDAGTEKVSLQTPQTGRILKELTLETSHGLRYVYLLGGNKERSPKSYVQHNVETGITITDFYVLNTDPENELNWLYLNSRENFDKGEATTIDTFNVQFRGGFITSFPKMTLTNDNLRPAITGHKAGPIRTVTQLKTTLVIAKVPVISQQMQAHRFGWHFEAHAHNKIPYFFKKTVADPSMKITLDGNAQHGGTTETARWKGKEAIVDGVMSKAEKDMVKEGITMEENWILFRNPQDMMLMTIFEAPDSMKHLPISMVYDDDARSKLKNTERFPGHLPDVGYSIKGMPDVSDMIFSMRMLMMKDLGGLSAEEFASVFSEKPFIVFNDLER